MKRRKVLAIIASVMIMQTSFTVQASMPVPDLLPIGQLKLYKEPSEENGQRQQRGG